MSKVSEQIGLYELPTTVSQRTSVIINAAMPWFIVTSSFMTTLALTLHGSYLYFNLPIASVKKLTHFTFWGLLGPQGDLWPCQ